MLYRISSHPVCSILLIVRDCNPCISEVQRPKMGRKEIFMSNEQLLSILNERGISRYRLACLADIPVSRIYGALAGREPLHPAWRHRIADALQVPEAELFPEQEGGKGNEKV